MPLEVERVPLCHGDSDVVMGQRCWRDWITKINRNHWPWLLALDMLVLDKAINMEGMRGLALEHLIRTWIIYNWDASGETATLAAGGVSTMA